MKHMIVIINNVREKCLVSMFTQFRQGGLGDGRPSLTALVMMDCNHCLSEASMNPHQTGEAYNNLLISVAWVTSHRALPPSPCDFRTLRAKKVWAHRLIRLSIWGEMVLNSYTQDHHLTHSLYSLDRWRW